MGQTPSNVKKEHEELGGSTHFDMREIKALFKQFKRENPSGQVTRTEFNEVMEQMGLVDPFLQERIFRIFDANNDGVISFQEFVVAWSVMSRGTPSEKLDLAFSMYDLDGHGAITKDHMEQVVDSFYKLVGPVDESPLVTFSGKKYEAPQQVVEEFFEQMDADGDGRVTLTEYKDGAFKNPDIISGLKLFAAEK